MHACCTVSQVHEGGVQQVLEWPAHDLEAWIASWDRYQVITSSSKFTLSTTPDQQQQIGHVFTPTDDSMQLLITSLGSFVGR